MTTRSLTAQRPHAVKLAGLPIATSYDIHTHAYTLRHRNPTPDDFNQPRSRETEIFLPSRAYAHQELIVELSDGSWRYDRAVDTLFWLHDDTTPGFVHSLVLRVGNPPRQPPPDIDLSDLLDGPRDALRKLRTVLRRLRPTRSGARLPQHVRDACLAMLHVIVLALVAGL